MIQNVPIPPNLILFTFVDLNPDELVYYPLIVSLDRCHESCNTVKHSFGRMCFPNKIYIKKIMLGIQRGFECFKDCEMDEYMKRIE